MVYTESFETRKGYSELVVEKENYLIEYIIKSPIDGKASEVNSTFSKVGKDSNSRIGYGSYYEGASSVRFDAASSVPFSVQSAINEQFMEDLEEILK